MLPGISLMLETSENQLVAAHGSQIMFYDFIDKQDRALKQKKAEETEKQNQAMKELFQTIDTENAKKLNKEDMMKYFQLLNQKLGSQFEHAA